MSFNLFKPNEHSKKEVVINQPASLGDILFIEPIYRDFHEQGYQVIAPVNADLLWVQPYIPYVKFIEKSKVAYNPEVVNQKNDGRLHVPTRFSNPLYRGFEDLHYGDDRQNWMRDKYLYLGLDESLWRTMRLERNIVKEDELYNKVVGDLTEYNFINPHFGGNFSSVNIVTDNQLPSIKMQKIAGYTMLDWRKVIEKATNIYTVETSIMWVIEAMETEAKEYHLYPRTPWLPNVDYIKSYLIKNWKFYDESDLQ